MSTRVDMAAIVPGLLIIYESRIWISRGGNMLSEEQTLPRSRCAWEIIPVGPENPNQLKCLTFIPIMITLAQPIVPYRLSGRLPLSGRDAIEAVFKKLRCHLHRAYLALRRADGLGKLREPLKRGLTHGDLALKDPYRIAGPSRPPPLTGL